MTAPNVALTIQEGGLGILPATADGIHVKMGVASGLTPLTMYTFADLPAIVASGGTGPALDAAAVALTTVVNGVRPPVVYVFPVTPSTAATSGSVTPVRTSTSTGTVATTGSTPYDTYTIKVTITTTGTLGTAAFTYTLDGGDTTSAPIAVPGGGTYAIPSTGVTAVFTAGGGPIFFEAGDTFSWSTVAPAMTVSDIGTAMTALLLLTPAWEGVHVVGTAVDHTATATLFAALATHAATMEASKRYRWIFMEASDSTDANLISAMASSSNTRMLVGAGFEEIYIPTTKLVLKRPAAWSIVGRGMAIPVHEDAARVASGPVTGVVSLYRNEDLTPGLDSARFSTMRQFVNNDPSGFFVTNARIFGGSLSDFQYWQDRRVMDKACTIARPILLNLLNDSVQVETTGARKGKIREISAIQIEKSSTMKLLATMSRHVTDATVHLSRDDLILSTKTLTVTISLIPFGYFKQIVATISLSNPALAPA